MLNFFLQGYRPCAQRASILFFVLNDLGRIDPMYQFSLDAYIELFNNSIEKSKRSQKLEERIQNLNEHHTYAVYRYVLQCMGMCGNVQTCVVVYRHLWQCVGLSYIDRYVTVQCMQQCIYTQRSIGIFSIVFLGMYRSVCQCTCMRGSLQLSLTVYRYVWQCIGMCCIVQVCGRVNIYNTSQVYEVVHISVVVHIYVMYVWQCIDMCTTVYIRGSVYLCEVYVAVYRYVWQGVYLWQCIVI